jgi:uncharacterized membrane protein YqjE
MLNLLPKLAPLAVQHLSAYVELAAAESSLFARDLTARLVAAAVALLGAIFTLMIGTLWILASVWDTTWRNPVIAALFLLFAAVAVVGVVIAVRRWPLGKEPFSQLRDEWNRDQTMMRECSEPPAGEASFAEPRLTHPAEV